MNIPTSNQCRVHTIVGEVQSVIATMRNNNRFSSLSTRESPLLKEFKQLRSQLRPSTDIEQLDPMVYLKPFLNLIHSEETSVLITGAALTSIDKFLTYGFLRDSPSAAKAMKKIADTVVHCRFESTSSESDDVVLMKILRVLLSCLTCPAGGLLSDDSVFEMLSICYRMSRGRLSELLKKTAERTLTEIVHVIFLVNNIHNKIYFDGEPVKPIDESVVPPPSPIIEDHNPNSHSYQPRSDFVTSRGVRFQRQEQVSTAVRVGSTSDVKVSPGEFIPKPYGVGCVIKTFKFLVELASPMDENIPESLRQISIQLLNTIAETQPYLIERIPALLDLLCNDLCKSMLQNLHTENLDRLNLTMRLFFNLHISLRRHLKVQFEVFFNNLLEFILLKRHVTFEKQEIVLENLVQFFYQPDFLADIFANYDCHIHCTNTLEALSTFLYKSAFPLNGSLYSIQFLSLECLLAILETISSRCIDSDSACIVDETTSNLLTQRKSKAIFIKAAELFNKKPKEGIAFLEEKNLLSDSHQQIINYLRNGPGLDKKIIGEYLGKQDREFIQAFVNTFDFTGMEYVQALRLFLTAFLLSGDAQIIDRILECFAHRWYAQNPKNIFATNDTAYVLCYSVVMLNVDAHNPGVKVKMTEEEYIHRLRGINNGADLPYEFLQDVYRNITQHEIKISEESPHGLITDDKWSAILLRGNRIGLFIDANTKALDRDVFMLVCRAITAALSTVFETSIDSDLLETVLKGFVNCSLISSHFKLSSVFDSVVVHLCKFTTLITKKPYGTSSKRITLFGSDKKAHLATTAMFTLVLRHGDHLREAWRNIVRCIITLHEMELLPNLIEEDPFEGKKKTDKKVKREKESSNTSLFSSFIPGWWASEPVEEEVNPLDVEAEDAAKKTIANCSIKSIIDSTCQLQSESLVYLIKALILDSSPNTQEFNELTASFCLDLLTKITLINHSRINFVWVLVSDHFENIVQMAKSPSEFVEKAIVCLLYMCVTLAPKEEISSRIFSTFELFLKLDPSVAAAMSESIIIAVTRLLQKHADSINSLESWRIILALVERSASSPVACERGFRALSSLLNTTVSPPVGPALRPEAFHPYLHATMGYVNVNNGLKNRKGAPSTVELDSDQPTSIKAMNILYSLFEGISEIEDDSHSELHLSDKWRIYYVPLFQSWIKLCRDPRNDVRTHAMTLLQRALLSQYLSALSPEGVRRYFSDVMFPLLDSLLKPFPNESSESSQAVEETRVRAQQLLSRSLLQYLHQLTQLSDFHTKLWPKILCVIEQYMKADKIGLLRESIPETLKNIILVMLQMNVFHPSNTIQGQDIWTVSWMTIDGFCPSLKEDESFKASLNTFQRVPVSSKSEIEKASSVIHQLAREASASNGAPSPIIPKN